MPRFRAALALTVLGTVGAGRLPAQDNAVALRAIRYARAGGTQTMVDVFARVPLMLITPIGPGGGAFRFAVTVRDSSGLELVSQAWSEAVRAEVLRTRGASTGQRFHFAARPGRYSVEVSVTDSATGRVTRATAPVEAFAGPVPAADLLLATDIRAAGATDTLERSGEVRKGSLVLSTTGDPVLTPHAARLGYYLELYPVRAETASVAVRVLSETGTQVIAAAPSAVALGAGGGFAYGLLDLTGLPPGRYALEVSATGPDLEAVRTAGFGMAGLQTLATAAAVTEAAEWPAGLSEERMDEAYAPLIYLMTQDEQGQYSSLSLEGKRNWLKVFWAKRDPTPGTGRNEDRERFYAYIAEANRQFREGGASEVPGWRTDRGRIFIKRGPPDDTYSRKVTASGNPYEVWRYTRTRAYTYIFMDLTRFGNYTLIYTNDPKEPSRQGWEALLGADALRELEQQD